MFIEERKEKKLEDELNRKDLKIQALLEKISSIVTNYENEISEYRVEMTLLNQKMDAMKHKDAENVKEEKEPNSS